jgi:hypothetical protein
VRVSFWEPAGTVNVPGKGEFRQKFGPDAFAGVIGSVVPWTYEGGRVGEATVIGVEVAPDGSGATFTVDIEETR